MMRKLSVIALLFVLATGFVRGSEVPTINLEPNPATAARHWRPGPASPAAARHNDALLFPCPLRRGMDRVYWDRDVNFNLAHYPLLELEISCPRPDAVRRIGLYLKSGKGWYVWLKPLAGSGRQTLFLAQREAGAEGQPAGWHKIDGIRLSVMPSLPLDTTITLHALKAKRPALAVVRGTTSCPNQAERNAANSATRRISQWLDDLRLPYSLLNDEDVSAGRLSGARLAILPYNPHPSRWQIQALQNFADQGGKFMVFYSADPKLAEMLGMRLGEYQRARQPGQWNAFAFNRNAPDDVPALVFQDSSNIRPILPDSRHAKTIAYWQNAAGKSSSDPAWALSKRGCWMSHILLNGDDENKKLLILALAGHFEPSVWREAALAAFANVGRIGGYSDLPTAQAGITALAAAGGRRDLVQPALDRANDHYRQLRKQMAAQNYQKSFQESRHLQRALLQAYSAAHPPCSMRLRGVWNHSGMGLYPGDWPRTARLLKSSGINAIFPNLLWAGTAHYPSKIVPPSDISRIVGDQLRQSANAARAAGLEIHLWKVCWNLGNAPAEKIEQWRSDGRLQRTADGETLPWLCPSHPKNIAQEINAIREAVASGLLDGIHLDYLRYPGPHACFCNGCRQRFEKALGQRVSGWPAKVRNGPLANRFQEWRCDQITEFVRRVRQVVKELDPQIKLSAAVYQGYPDCRRSVGQDWGHWLKNGLLDFVVPMNYTSSSAEFADVLRRQTALPGAAHRIYPGLGVTAAESRLTPDRVIEQISQAEALHCGGFVLFDLNATLAEETLPILRLGPTSRP